MSCEHCEHCTGAAPVVRFGVDPKRMEVTLCRDAVFFQTFSRADGQPWDPGTVIELRIAGQVWVAELSGADGEISASVEQVNDAIEAGVSRARMFASVDDVPVNWFNGEVSVRV